MVSLLLLYENIEALKMEEKESGKGGDRVCVISKKEEPQ